MTEHKHIQLQHIEQATQHSASMEKLIYIIYLKKEEEASFSQLNDVSYC